MGSRCYAARVKGLLLFGAVALAALFLGLDRVDFMDDREARDAAVATEIAGTREFLTPRLGGQPWFEKPFLGYGLEIAGLRLTPESPTGPRALRALGAVLLTLVVGLMGRRHAGGRAGVCAAVVFATSLALPLAARSDGTQILASLLTWLAIGAWLDVLHGRAPRAALIGAYLCLAIVMLIAGPLPALWPFAAMAFTLGRARRWDLWRRLQPWSGLILVLGAALPWYGAILEREGPMFLLRALEFPYALPEITSWFAAPARALGYVFVGFFPWSTLLAAAMLRAAGLTLAVDMPRELPPPEHFFVGALLMGLAPLMIASDAPASAVLAILPAMALLVGPVIDRALADEAIWQRAVGQAAWVLAITGTVAGWLLSTLSRRLAGAGDSEVRLLAVMLFVASWAPLLAGFLRRPRALPTLLALPVALGTVMVAWRTLPGLADLLTTRTVSQSMAQIAPPDAPLVLLQPPPASLRLRAGRPLVVADQLSRDLHSFRARDGHTYVAFPEARQSELAGAVSPRAVEILARTPALCLARVLDE